MIFGERILRRTPDINFYFYINSNRCRSFWVRPKKLARFYPLLLMRAEILSRQRRRENKGSEVMREKRREIKLPVEAFTRCPHIIPPMPPRPLEVRYDLVWKSIG